MPGLQSMGHGLGCILDGLQERYGDDDAQPLQAVVDAAADGVRWMEEEGMRLRAPQAAASSPGEGPQQEVSGCVSETGAGAWG